MKDKRNTFKYWKSFSLFTKKILLIPLYLQDLIFMHLLLQAAYTGVKITFFPKSNAVSLWACEALWCFLTTKYIALK